jgi:aryl-phospho-beta-D-glucosidase BglC (GH1 family)
MIGAGVRSVRFGSMGSTGGWLAVLVWAGATACGSGGSAEAWVPDPFVPTAPMSALQVNGNRIVDESGATVVLRGLALADPDQVARDGHWDEHYFQQARSWGARVVRIPIHPQFWRARGPKAYVALLDQAVGWAEQRGMYVILDWHSIGDPVAGRYQDAIYQTTQDETKAFWTTVSTRYMNDPAVAFYELWNETTNLGSSTTWHDWKGLAEQLIDLVRVQRSNAIAIVGGFNWSYDLTPVGADPVLRGNVAYSVHPYPIKRGPINTTAWGSDFGYLTATYPVFATEFGFDTDPSDTVANATADGYGKSITDYFASKGMSWTVWCFHPTWSPVLLKDWSYAPAEPQGTFFQTLLTNQ